MNYTTQDYIDSLKRDKETLKTNLEKLGVEVTEGDNFTTLAQKIGTISPSGNLQYKSVEITENGLVSVIPDEGYTGLSSVDINTNVVGEETAVFNGKDKTSLATGIISFLTKINKNVFKDVVLNQKTTSNLFANLVNLSVLDISELDLSTESFSIVSYMFNKSTCKIIFPKNAFANTTTLYSLFDGYAGKELDFSNFNSSKVTTFRYLTRGCSNVKTIVGIENLDVSKSTNLSYALSDLGALTSPLDLSSWNTERCTDMSYMFASSSQATSMDINLVTLPINFGSGAVNMSYIFQNVKGDVTNNKEFLKMNTTKVNNLNSCFASTTRGITGKLDIHNWDISSLTQLASGFSYSNLSKIDISSWSNTKAVNIQQTFFNCKLLEEIDADNFDFTLCTSSYRLFEECGSTAKPTKIYVKDEANQNWVLTANNGHPTYWNTDNIIIAGSEQDLRTA